MQAFHPILNCAEARALEERRLGADEERVWAAMERAGAGVGQGVLRDFPQWQPLPRDPRVLVLAGPGHNGGDALLAAREVLLARPRGRATVVLLDVVEELKPLTRRAWEALAEREGVQAIAPEPFLSRLRGGETWDIVLDGLYGMSFRPPLREPARKIVLAMNDAPEAAGFRAAVDVPSGVSDRETDLAFRADFTYATGIVKSPLVTPANAAWVGRIRYVDIGFFVTMYDGARSWPEEWLTEDVLEPLRRLRSSAGDKRKYGHLLAVTGSRSYPGAQMLNVLGALRAGAGLVTALAPASHAGAFAAARPEAMWRACPEEADGGHGAATLAAAREFWEKRASAMLVGSGLGRGAHTQAMVKELVEECPLPLVLDADALTVEVLEAVGRRPKKAGPVVVTPHAGEFARLAGANADLKTFCKTHRVVTVLKGPLTRICDGTRTWVSGFGGPVLARGGSGDVLAGIVGALLSQLPTEPFEAAAMAVAWHGLAADALAAAKGETAVLTAELAGYLGEALRG